MMKGRQQNSLHHYTKMLSKYTFYSMFSSTANVLNLAIVGLELDVSIFTGRELSRSLLLASSFSLHIESA